jgi:DNA modification methylase
MTDKLTLHHGDCLEVLRSLPDCSVDSVVTDPPYGLSFMGKRWDYDVPSVEVWAECLRVLKPGGHLLAFAGTRTQHRMAVRIEGAGFEIRDMIAWVYGSGFPKSLDVSKAIDKMDAAQEQQARRYRFTEWVRSTGITSKQIDEATQTNMGGHYTTAASQPAIMTREHLEACRHLLGDIPEWVEREADIRSVESKNFAEREVVGQHQTDMGGLGGERLGQKGGDITAPATPEAKQWQGWGTALKPALEPITVARKPLIGTVAENVLQHGTGAINVDGGRVGTEQRYNPPAGNKAGGNSLNMSAVGMPEDADGSTAAGRWPANFIHDGSEEATDLLGASARFFYCAKASKADRDEGCEKLQERSAGECVDRVEGSAGMESPRAGAGRTSGSRNHHPTVKPTDLMRYLCRLVTPPSGIVLDPFMGSGSTGKAAMLEGFAFVGIEREAEYIDIAKARIQSAVGLL